MRLMAVAASWTVNGVVGGVCGEGKSGGNPSPQGCSRTPTWHHQTPSSSTSSSCYQTGESLLLYEHTPQADPFPALLLSNLPTGGFIASSGLESYIQHGYLSSDDSASKAEGVLSFIRKSIHSYASLNLPFLTATHTIFSTLHATPPQPSPSSSSTLRSSLAELESIDKLFETMTLNHVARRASAAQGVALLTLYERAFSAEQEDADKELVGLVRLAIRQGSMYGHLPVGFGILTGALGLSLPASQHLFLFLHARSLLSSSIRLNTVGPYVCHRLLLHDVRPLVDEALAHFQHHKLPKLALSPSVKMSVNGFTDDDEDEEENGPATAWPLLEIVTARHDQLHSKIFNS